ncbi:MAG: PorP/SprF family type IX secretion system membrane protein [Fluviicola sp.]|nr:PorP/SprF family type IX secretion system membrane protein [Fluviicola sp.]
MIKRITLIAIFFLGVHAANAQDAHLSLYDAAPLSLNPAMTGVFEGDWRLHGQYRTQWKSVNFKPYQTGLISFDMSKKKWGFGIQISNFRAGQGNYNALQGSVSAAYTTSLDRRKHHNLSFGLQAGVTQKSIEYQLLTYNNQYTTIDGGGFNQDLGSLENFNGQSVILPVTNVGLLYFFAKQESRLNPFIGLSAFNLLEPKESLYGIDNRLPMRFYGHFGTRINVTELFYLIPKLLVMNQGKFWEQTYALDAGYYLKNNDFYLLGGVIVRSVGDVANTFGSDAMIISIGAKMENIVAKIAYDVNVSKLSRFTAGKGGFEVSVTYTHQKKKPRTEKICPRL